MMWIIYIVGCLLTVITVVYAEYSDGVDIKKEWLPMYVVTGLGWPLSVPLLVAFYIFNLLPEVLIKGRRKNADTNKGNP